LLIVGAGFLLLQVIQKAVKERTALRAAGATARNVWNHGSDEQRQAMLDLVSILEASYRDLLATKTWDDLPETVRTSIAKNFLV
jgi:hypothetical protein